MKTRIISAVCMLPLLVFLVIGKLPLLIIIMLLSGVALYEFYQGFEKLEIKASKPVGFALLLILYLILFASFVRVKDIILYDTLSGMWLFLAMLSCLILIVTDKNHNILGPSFTLLGVIYIVSPISHLYLIDQCEHAFVWLPVIIAVFTDIGGYFCGMYFGKHKLAPVLSPKKTVEGSLGGLLLGTLASFVFFLIIDKERLIDAIILGILGSVLAQLGDIVASAFKRKMGIKDYSHIIPGHGGVLDRIDSWIFVIPLVYYYLTVFFK